VRTVVQEQHEAKRKALLEEMDRPGKQRVKKTKKQLASVMFQQGGVHHVHAAQQETARRFAVAMRQIEEATGVNDPELLLERFLRLHDEHQNAAQAVQRGRRGLDVAKDRLMVCLCQRIYITWRVPQYTDAASLSPRSGDDTGKRRGVGG
jgi:hypothetical protein